MTKLRASFSKTTIMKMGKGPNKLFFRLSFMKTVYINFIGTKSKSCVSENRYWQSEKKEWRIAGEQSRLIKSLRLTE